MGDDHRGTTEKNSAGTDDAVRARYDWATTPPLVAVVETIATAVGCDDLEVDSVYESVDLDALGALVRRSGRGAGEDVHVTFPYEDWTVTVRGSGEVVVQRDPLATPARRSDGESGTRPGV